jgi:hypothetical protein
MRVPRPAAKIMQGWVMRGRHGGAHQRLEAGQGGVGEVAPDVAPDARQQREVARLAPLAREAGEDAEDAEVAREAQGRGGSRDARLLAPAGFGEAGGHGRAEVRVGVAPRVAQERGEVVFRGRPASASWKSSRPRRSVPSRWGRQIRFSAWKSRKDSTVASGA